MSRVVFRGNVLLREILIAVAKAVHYVTRDGYFLYSERGAVDHLVRTGLLTERMVTLNDRSSALAKAYFLTNAGRKVLKMEPVKFSSNNFIEAHKIVLRERRRQVEIEGWSHEHDDKHADGELSFAGSAYLNAKGAGDTIPAKWPWDKQWWKPSDDRMKNLARAGALFLAEHERINRRLMTIKTGESSSVLISDRYQAGQLLNETREAIAVILASK